MGLIKMVDSHGSKTKKLKDKVKKIFKGLRKGSKNKGLPAQQHTVTTNVHNIA